MNTELNKRTCCEMASIFREHEQAFRRDYRLCGVQEKAFSDILQCRTVQAGGHLNRCDHCGHEMQAYNSCRNRNCPKCLSLKQEQWIDKLQGRLLPTRYFHLVFTIPHQLNPLFYINQEICYALLFRAAWKALNQGCRNPRISGSRYRCGCCTPYLDTNFNLPSSRAYDCSPAEVFPRTTWNGSLPGKSTWFLLKHYPECSGASSGG